MLRASFHIMVFLFFLSGLSALMLEIIWQRMMVLVFGASAPATIATLTAFFCGIALGSRLGGILINRVRNVIRFYAFTELWIAVFALLVPWNLKIMDALQLRWFHGLEEFGPFFFSTRFIMAILVILPATIGMGATIPAMNRILGNWRDSIGQSVAVAYGANTLGSVIGCLLVGFWSIPVLGMKASMVGAALVNIFIFSSLMISRQNFAELESSLYSGEKQVSAGEIDRRTYRGLKAVYFCCGFLALGYEVTWFRILGIYNGNSIITFTIALAVYLAGFSIGSLILYPLLRKRFQSATTLILANWGTAFFLLCLIPLYYYFPEIRTAIFDNRTPGTTYIPFINVLITEIGSAIVVLLLPSLCMGMAYPSVCQTCISRTEQLAKESGRIFFLGSIGSALGAFVVGLFIIPSLDLVGTLGFLGSMSCLICLITMFIVKYQNSMLKTFFQYSSLLLIVLSFLYGLSGPPFAKDSRLIKEESGWRFQNNQYEHVIHYKSGASATVSVRHTEVPNRFKFRVIFVDGQEVASTLPMARGDSKMLAHLPLMLHANPKRALTVGFGSGGTSWSMTRYGIDVDCVEIEPEVVRSAHLFSDQNHQVLGEPNMNLIINDARNYLHLTKQRYDVISTDVTNLHYKQNSSLYTREYFSLLKSRLTKDGIAAAWVPLTGIDERDFKIFLRTFQDVFAHSSLWTIGKPSESYYAIVLGTPDELRIDDARLAKMFTEPDIVRDLAEIGIFNPRMFRSFLLLDETGTRHYAGNATLHTDDHPVLEFYSARDLYSKEVNINSVLEFRTKISR